VLSEFVFTQKKESQYRKAIKSKLEENMELKHKEHELEVKVEQLSETVIKDSLTQVYNRRFFADKIRDVFLAHKNKRQMVALLMVDIDFFKKINDTFGHLVGDEVLKAVSKVLREMTPNQGFCCRYGGEEFSIILPMLSPHKAEQLAELIRQQVSQLTFEAHPNLAISVSVGLASVDFMHAEPQSTLHNQEDLIKLADDQLYAAKTNGRNQVRKVIL
jgi:diguanylate cyclase (GGDEF)-like protein